MIEPVRKATFSIVFPSLWKYENAKGLLRGHTNALQIQLRIAIGGLIEGLYGIDVLIKDLEMTFEITIDSPSVFFDADVVKQKIEEELLGEL